MRSNDDVVVVGGGPAGAVLATMLAEAGCQVRVYESRPDPRSHAIEGGRSINLTLARRGMVVLESVGVLDELAEISMPLAGRMIHAGGQQQFHRYGRRAGDVIHSISRNGLNAVLLDKAESTGRVHLQFERRLQAVDFTNRRLSLTAGRGSEDSEANSVGYGVLYGADGSNSAVRRAMVDRGHTESHLEPLDHGYKEIEIPADRDGGHQLEPDALHIWPRGEFMLAAFANPDGTFTVTLFMPETGSANSFTALAGRSQIEAFFEREFPTFVPLVPDLVDQFLANPVGHVETIRTSGWSVDDRVCLVGDAAHTLVPFHGQGMNLALESVQALFRCLERFPSDRGRGFERYESERKANADAIADMALANYVELRSGVIDPHYLIERQLEFELERRWPHFFATRYDMVTFTTMPFADVLNRTHRQSRILNELTESATSLADIDYEAAHRLVRGLGTLPSRRRYGPTPVTRGGSFSG